MNLQLPENKVCFNLLCPVPLGNKKGPEEDQSIHGKKRHTPEDGWSICGEKEDTWKRPEYVWKNCETFEEGWRIHVKNIVHRTNKMSNLKILTKITLSL